MFTFKELTPRLWKDIESLFGDKGACGGCWCMHWRQVRGENWKKVQGLPNKNRFKKLVQTGKAHGALAYSRNEPIGWISFDRRKDFIKLDRAPSLQCDDADKVWSIPCFYIRPQFRGKKVGTQLLKFAVQVLKKKKAKIIEGYPLSVTSKNPLPGAFAWVGTVSLFKKAGFKKVLPQKAGKQRMRLKI